jgi:hypothetical protein
MSVRTLSEVCYVEGSIGASPQGLETISGNLTSARGAFRTKDFDDLRQCATEPWSLLIRSLLVIMKKFPCAYVSQEPRLLSAAAKLRHVPEFLRAKTN